MLEMKQQCERCNSELSTDSKDAFICSYECTFCRDCTMGDLQNTCPNCGGELVARPTRAAKG